MMANVRPAGAKELIIFIWKTLLQQGAVKSPMLTQGAALGWVLLALQAD